MNTMTKEEIIKALSNKYGWNRVSEGWYNEDYVIAVDILINDCGATLKQAIKHVEKCGTDVYHLIG